MGYINKIAIDEDVFNWLNSMSWLTWNYSFVGLRAREAHVRMQCIFVCVDGYLTIKEIIKKVKTLCKSKVGYSL